MSVLFVTEMLTPLFEKACFWWLGFIDVSAALFICAFTRFPMIGLKYGKIRVCLR